MPHFKSLKSLSLEELTHRADLLKKVCLNLDPYSPLNESQVKTLLSLGVKDLDDPFRVTNELILKMENILEEIQKRNHPSKIVQ